MTDEQIKLAAGALLHDIGKVICPTDGVKRTHSRSGYEFLADEAGISNQQKEILDSVLYHHADLLRQADIPEDSFAYIVYIANNIVSASDRRKAEAEDAEFEISMPLQSVFNILNGNQQEFYYEPKTLDSGHKKNLAESGSIPYPAAEKKAFNKSFYSKIKQDLLDILADPDWTPELIHALLNVLESDLSYIPSSAAQQDMADISLYDHLKLTAAAAACIYEYAAEKNITNYRESFFQHAADFYAEKAFLLYSMDISGIQDFIYTIASKDALKTLRARSFYLEIMMEHIIDSLLYELHLSRANLIYSGGGHCYLLLPNTKTAEKTAQNYQKRVNSWLMDTFDISLFIAAGSVPCSADALKNIPAGSYSQLFKQMGNEISKQKNSRYSAAEIRMLNQREPDSYTKECRVCKKTEKVNEEGVCPLCRAVAYFSKNILYDDFFTVSSKEKKGSLPLPGGYYLTAGRGDAQKTAEDADFVRAYSKNQTFTGKHAAVKIWTGSYTSGKNFEEYAQLSEGISRIGILRADVDNLGQAFVSGFENPKNQNRYVAIARTAALSRQLSLFFKYHINQILEKSDYSIGGKKPHARSATICYSGGDDLFIIGSWNEVMELAVDIRRAFEKYTQNTLTLSAGIGIYPAGYPISTIAGEVGAMEELSKALPGKNGITILNDGQEHTVLDDAGKEIRISGGTYRWQEFEQSVLEEKYQTVSQFFNLSGERGRTFLYHLYELIRGREEKINFARFVYILSRLEPEDPAASEQNKAYRRFSSHMYQWFKDEDHRRQLKTAINLYAYMTREKEAESDDH